MRGYIWAITAAVVLAGGIVVWILAYRSTHLEPDCNPPGMRVVRIETFGPENASDKIDGHADLYVSSGLKSLTCTLFQGIEDPTEQFEACDYEMASFRQAFSVFSRQIREDADAFEDDLGYKVSDGAAFFIAGSHYFEVIPVNKARGIDAYVECRRREKIIQEQQIPEARFLPQKGRILNSFTLLPQAVFGFDRLDGVVVARYKVNDEEAAIFVSLRESESEAQGLADALVRFFLDAGGELVGTSPDGGRVIRLLDAFEVVTTRGRLLAGVHEAPTIEAAESLVAMITRDVR